MDFTVHLSLVRCLCYTQTSELSLGITSSTQLGFSGSSLEGQAGARLRKVVEVVLVAQSCPTLCDPTDCSPPGSSVRGILQARILEWVAMSFSRGSSRPRDQIWVSHIADRFFTV